MNKDKMMCHLKNGVVYRLRLPRIFWLFSLRLLPTSFGLAGSLAPCPRPDPFRTSCQPVACAIPPSPGVTLLGVASSASPLRPWRPRRIYSCLMICTCHVDLRLSAGLSFSHLFRVDGSKVVVRLENLYHRIIDYLVPHHAPM